MACLGRMTLKAVEHAVTAACCCTFILSVQFPTAQQQRSLATTLRLP
ncbi:hypothetical protein [Paenibacillus allorhizoplanae]|nr:hypothetical protein [Paenibacillus allorhizoplanae]